MSWNFSGERGVGAAATAMILKAVRSFPATGSQQRALRIPACLSTTTLPGSIRRVGCFVPRPREAFFCEVLSGPPPAHSLEFFCAFAKRPKRMLAAMQNPVLTNLPIFPKPGQAGLPRHKKSLDQKF